MEKLTDIEKRLVVDVFRARVRFLKERRNELRKDHPDHVLVDGYTEAITQARRVVKKLEAGA